MRAILSALRRSCLLGGDLSRGEGLLLRLLGADCLTGERERERLREVKRSNLRDNEPL